MFFGARSTFIALVVLATAVLLAAPASASFIVTVEADPISEPIPVGERATTTLRVTITSSDNILCAADSTVAIHLEAAGQAAADGFMADVSPAKLDIPISANVWSSTTGAYESDAVEATFTVSITDDVKPLHPGHSFQPTARFNADDPPGSCHTVEWKDASGSVSVPVTASIPPAEENGDGDDDAPNGTTDDEADTGEGPAPGVAIVVLVGALLYALRRRQ